MSFKSSRFNQMVIVAFLPSSTGILAIVVQGYTLRLVKVMCMKHGELTNKIPPIVAVLLKIPDHM